MIETLKQGLLITVVGMGIVFVMILILWAIMVLLVKLTNRPEKAEAVEEAPISLPEPAAVSAPGDASALAAVIAVAYAMSVRPKVAFGADTQSIQTGSAWLAAGRAQQVAQQNNRGRSA